MCDAQAIWKLTVRFVRGGAEGRRISAPEFGTCWERCGACGRVLSWGPNAATCRVQNCALFGRFAI
eukprot:15456268-Alexandrium_andersonii.AAC.1